MCSLRCNKNGVHACYRTFAYKASYRVHLYVFCFFHAHVVGDELTACVDDGCTARTYCYVFTPAVNHGVGKFGVLANVKFADAKMNCLVNGRVTRAACDYVQFCTVFYNYNVMYALQLFFVADEDAGLQGISNFFTSFYADEVTVFFFKGGYSSVLICIRSDCFPPVFFHQFRILFSSLTCIHQFQGSLSFNLGF